MIQRQIRFMRWRETRLRWERRADDSAQKASFNRCDLGGFRSKESSLREHCLYRLHGQEEPVRLGWELHEIVLEVEIARSGFGVYDYSPGGNLLGA
jgi:hypothetical protein